MTLVDANVILDLVSDDPNWADWSIARLEAASLNGLLLINDVIYAELSVRYDRIENLDAFVNAAGLEIVSIPRAALFLAGKVFTRYRKSGGSRTDVLPDFFIGAHAAISDMPLLTRDAVRYRTYFPKLRLITPEPRKPTHLLDLPASNRVPDLMNAHARRLCPPAANVHGPARSGY